MHGIIIVTKRLERSVNELVGLSYPTEIDLVVDKIEDLLFEFGESAGIPMSQLRQLADDIRDIICQNTE